MHTLDQMTTEKGGLILHKNGWRPVVLLKLGFHFSAYLNRLGSGS